MVFGGTGQFAGVGAGGQDVGVVVGLGGVVGFGAEVGVGLGIGVAVGGLFKTHWPAPAWQVAELSQ